MCSNNLVSLPVHLIILLWEIYKLQQAMFDHDCRYRSRLGESSLFVFITMMCSYAAFFAWRANLDVADPLMLGVVRDRSCLIL